MCKIKGSGTGGGTLSSSAHAVSSEILSLVDDQARFFKINGPYWGQNLYTGEYQFQLEGSPGLPDVRRNCTESLVEGGRIVVKLAAQNAEGIPLLGYRIKRIFDNSDLGLEGEVCAPWGSNAPSIRSKRSASVSIFKNCIPFPIRNATEFVYKVGVGDEGAKLIQEAEEDKGKQGKKEKKRIEALHRNATKIMRGLRASRRKGVDFTLNNFMRRGGERGWKGIDYSFQTSMEGIRHDFLEKENVLSSTYACNWDNDWDKKTRIGHHRVSVKFSSGLRFPSLGLEALGLGKWGLKNVKGFRKGIRAEGGGDNTDHTRRVLKHLVYEKPRFSRFEIGTVSKIPIIKADKDKWLFQLAVKNILTTGFGSSVPLHMREMNGFLLGGGIRGWKPKDHGPFTEGFRSTIEFRVGGDTGLRWIFFGDLLCFSRALKYTGGTGASEERNIKAKIRRANEMYNARAVTKTAAGFGVRFIVKGLRVKADIASLNSGQTKLHVGIGRDFSAEHEEDNDFNGF